MRTEDLLDAIGGVDDDLLQRSEKVKIKKANPWKVWVPLAACVCLVLGLKFLVSSDKFATSSADGAAADSATESFGNDMTANGGSASCDGKEAFDTVYALSMSEASDSIYATRQVGIDVVKTEAEYSIYIEDSYTLFNTSAEEIETEFAYMYNMDHSGTRPVFTDENGKEVGKAGSPIRVTIPANGQVTITGQYSKSTSLDETFTDCYIHGCKFTNLDVTEATVTFNREGNVETIQIDPVEDYYLD